MTLLSGQCTYIYLPAVLSHSRPQKSSTTRQTIPQSYFSDLLSGLEHNPGRQSSLLPTSMRQSPLPFTSAAHAVATHMQSQVRCASLFIRVRVRGVRPVSTRQKGPGVHSNACIQGTPGQTARPFREMGWCIPKHTMNELVSMGYQLWSGPTSRPHMSDRSQCAHAQARRHPSQDRERPRGGLDGVRECVIDRFKRGATTGAGHHRRGQYEGGIDHPSYSIRVRAVDFFDPLSPTLVSNTNTASRYRPSASFWLLDKLFHESNSRQEAACHLLGIFIPTPA